MIEFDRVTITYPDAAGPVLREVDLTIAEGELCLVAGHTGAGKSTLLRAVNGLVPHFTGGRLAGRVTVAGLADGEIVADGPTAEVVVASPAFAPQVSKVLAPGPWLTVDQVAAALPGTSTCES